MGRERMKVRQRGQKVKQKGDEDKGQMLDTRRTLAPKTHPGTQDPVPSLEAAKALTRGVPSTLSQVP